MIESTQAQRLRGGYNGFQGLIVLGFRAPVVRIHHIQQAAVGNGSGSAQGGDHLIGDHDGKRRGLQGVILYLRVYDLVGEGEGVAQGLE